MKNSLDYVFFNNSKLYNDIRAPHSKEHNTLSIGPLKASSAPQVSYVLSEKLSNFDLDVADAIYTLCHQKEEKIRLNDILRTLSGDMNQRVKTQNREKLLASIAKLRATTVRLDVMAHLSSNHYQETMSHDASWYHAIFSKEAPFLYLKDVKTGVYVIDNDSDYFTLPTHYYAELVKQVIRVPFSLLESDSPYKSTLQNIQIKRALIRRIEYETNNYKRNPTQKAPSAQIIYEYPSHREGEYGLARGLFPALGISQGTLSDESWEKKRVAIHKVIISYLVDLRTKGRIKACEHIKHGKKYTGVRFTWDTTIGN